MKINAYILAADPAWIEASVLSYYDLVDRIVVSYDKDGLGWTGVAIDVDQCLRRLKAIDKAGKFDYRPGHFARAEFFGQPMENDTHQRQVALDQAGEGADWVLQFDTDEVLPNSTVFLQALEKADGEGVAGLEWPMRVLFQRTRAGQFLEICDTGGRDRFEYPGPLAVRARAKLVDARRAEGDFVRMVVRGDGASLQIKQAPDVHERRWELANSEDAILHNSWARDARSVRAKIGSWSHNQGVRSWLYYVTKWRLAPLRWRSMRDFHPFARGLWPALKLASCVPPALERMAHV